MPRAKTVLTLLVPLLSACAATPTPRESAVFRELQVRLQERQFEMVSPPRGDYRPGTALDIGAANTVTLCNLEAAAAAVEETPALFMNDLALDESTEVALRAVVALGGDPTGQTGNATAELTRRGVQRIRIRFKECTIQSIPLARLQSLLDGLAPAEKRNFENGAEVIVEALVATGAELAFSGQTEDVAALGAQVLAQLTGGRAEVKQTTGSQFSVAVADKICLGMKTRTLFTDGVGDAIAALDLPRALVDNLRSAKGLMRAEVFQEITQRFQELRGQWLGFGLGAMVEYRNQKQSDVRLLSGVAQSLESEATAKGDRRAIQPLMARVKAIRQFVSELVRVVNHEINETNKDQRARKRPRLDRITK